MRRHRPSHTAFKVASAIVMLGAREGSDAILPPGLVRATERILLESGRLGPRALRLYRSPFVRGLVERFDGGLGVLDGVGLRKAFCEREVRAAIAGGASQVLVLGAGYDTLCWRLAPELPEVRFFEVDHPATAAAKTRAVDAMGRPSNMAMIAADLGAQPLTEVLDAEGSWRADTRSVVIAEGLLYYSPAAAVLDLLHRVAECTASGSRVAFTFMEPGTLARSRWMSWGAATLRLMREPWLWFIERGDLPGFLAGTPWRLAPPAGGPDAAGLDRFAVAQRA